MDVPLHQFLVLADLAPPFPPNAEISALALQLQWRHGPGTPQRRESRTHWSRPGPATAADRLALVGQELFLGVAEETLVGDWGAFRGAGLLDVVGRVEARKGGEMEGR